MTEVDLNSIEAASVVDARGVSCPGPLLEAKKAMAKIKVGDILEVKSNDPGSRKDIPAWSKKKGHDFLGFLEVDGCDRIFVKRGK